MVSPTRTAVWKGIDRAPRAPSASSCGSSLKERNRRL